MSGLRIPMNDSINETKSADAILFASGVGVQKIIRNPQYLKNLQLNADEQLIGSMCSGALILGALGLLKGKKATTYPTAVQQLRKYDVQVVEESFVNNGNISTAAGCLAAQTLSAWIITTLVGKEMADKVIETVQPIGSGLQFN